MLALLHEESPMVSEGILCAVPAVTGNLFSLACVFGFTSRLESRPFPLITGIWDSGQVPDLCIAVCDFFLSSFHVVELAQAALAASPFLAMSLFGLLLLVSLPR